MPKHREKRIERRLRNSQDPVTTKAVEVEALTLAAKNLLTDPGTNQ